jgi:hypothetical protein
MLELRDETPVGRAKRPSVVIVDHVVSRDGQERLDGQHQTLAKNHLLAVIDARDGRVLMESSPDAVTTQVPDDTKPMTSSSLLDGSADIAKTGPRLRRVHRIALCLPCRLEQPRGNEGDFSDGDADARIREVAIQLGRDVEVDEVTGVELAPERGDSMGGFIVHADARGAGKSVGHAGSRPSAVASEHLSANRIELAGRGARSNGLDHGSTRFGDNPTGTKKGIEILLLVNRHGAILGPADLLLAGDSGAIPRRDADSPAHFG